MPLRGPGQRVRRDVFGLLGYICLDGGFHKNALRETVLGGTLCSLFLIDIHKPQCRHDKYLERVIAKRLNKRILNLKGMVNDCRLCRVPSLLVEVSALTEGEAKPTPRCSLLARLSSLPRLGPWPGRSSGTHLGGRALRDVNISHNPCLHGRSIHICSLGPATRTSSVTLTQAG